MSLRDGMKKMSKSDPSDLSRINLTDAADTIAKKVQKAKTDADGIPSEAGGLKNRPEADNLVGIYAALSGGTVDKVLVEFGGQQFSTFKKALAELAAHKLGPIATESAKLMADPAHIDAILADGSTRARAIATPVLNTVKDIVGFIRA
jgi:tryptophanyl-tRNA synthetase